jgi:hypothetical protein
MKRFSLPELTAFLVAATGFLQVVIKIIDPLFIRSGEHGELRRGLPFLMFSSKLPRRSTGTLIIFL